MRKDFFYLLVVFLLPFSVFGAEKDKKSECHYALRGRVVEADTKEAIAFASVYVQETKQGVVSDESGFFELKNLCRGTFTIEFSHIECQHKTQTIVIDADEQMTFELEHATQVLGSVTVKDKKTAPNSIAARSDLQGRTLEETKGKSLGEALTKLAGVTMLNTGSTIAKPVVQGLHSDRVLILNNGVKLESQAWGLDHAPEIDAYLADKISVIKGAGSLRYGVGAIGGVVLVEPRNLRDSLGIGGEVHLGGFSNGRVGVFSGLLEGKKSEPWAWRVQGTTKKGGDQHTPDYILRNTGIEELAFSAAVGYQKDKWKSELFYSYFYTKIGIFKDSHIGNLTDLKLAIERGRPLNDSADFSYTIARPAQRVSHDILKLKTEYKTGEIGTLRFNLYGQYDNRREYDAHRPGRVVPTGFDRAEIAFKMPSMSLRTEWEHNSFRNWQGYIGTESSVQQNNTIRGALIPDYFAYNLGAFWVERWRKYPTPWEWEMGVRYDYKYLKADSVRNTTRWREPFEFSSVSATGGGIYHFGEANRVALQAATAWRSPNVNELFSYGVHHGTASFEAGDVNLQPERAYNISLSTHLHSDKGIEIDLNLFQNYIQNFIFLQADSSPVLTIRGAFPSFSYHQTDAMLRGGDLNLNYQFSKKWSWQVKASTLFAQNIAEKKYTWIPLMPADRIENTLRFEQKKTYISTTVVNVVRQKRLPSDDRDLAQSPEGYARLDANFGTEWKIKGWKNPLEIGLSAQNILNTRYRDYLDRFRYYSDTQGVNVGVRIKAKI